MSQQPSLSQTLGLPILYPTSSFSTVPLTTGERATVLRTINDIGKVLSRASPSVGQDFLSQTDFFLAVATIAKAKFQQATNFPPSDNAALSAQIPSSGQIGIQPIIPEDIKNNQAGSTPTAPTAWDISATAGTTVYLIGSSASGNTGYFSTNGTEPNRYILALMKNGLVEVGADSPTFDQFYYTTSQQSYVPFTEQPLFQIITEPTKQVYQYNTPAAVIMDETILTKLEGMPKYSVNTRVALVGLKFYEYSQYTSMVD